MYIAFYFNLLFYLYICEKITQFYIFTMPVWGNISTVSAKEISKWPKFKYTAYWALSISLSTRIIFVEKIICITLFVYTS